ncbi:MAG: MIP/aquaporin family protein [Fusobacteriaceae bacterium]
MNIYLAEFIGTMLLVLFGNGVVACCILPKSKGNGGGWIAITAGWGFAVMLGAYATGWISGAYLNPALTVAFATVGKLSWSVVPGYLLAEVLGGMLGQLLVYLAYKNHYDEATDQGAILGTCSTAPAIRNFKWNFVTEMIGGCVLAFGLLAIGHVQNTSVEFVTATGDVIKGSIKIIGPLLAGFYIWAIGLSLGGPTGYAINPARDLGPRIMHSILPIKNKGTSDWGYAWVPIIGPTFGAIIGSLIFVALYK